MVEHHFAQGNVFECSGCGRILLWTDPDGSYVLKCLIEGR